MDGQEQPAIANELREIRQRLDVLSAPLESLLVSRVVEGARNQIKLWVGVWISVPVFILGFLGFQGIQAWRSVIDTARIQATQATGEEVKKVIDDMRPEIQTKVRERVDQEMKSFLLNSESQASSEFTNLLNTRLQEFATRLAGQLHNTEIEKLARPSGVPSNEQAFAYYGQRSGDRWAARHFDIVSKDPAQLPKAGDVVIAIDYVNARKNYIEYKPSRGWVNAPIVGLISPKDRLEVTDTQTVYDGFVWIAFKRIR